MKHRYSFTEHYTDVRKVLFKEINGSFDMNSVELRTTMIAYERWLNKRNLMSLGDLPIPNEGEKDE